MKHRLRDHLRRQAATVAAAGVRTDESTVHETRVAIRRLRSALRVFAPLLTDPAAAHELDRELRWLAGLYGEVRDRQLQRRRFADSELDTGFLEAALYDEQAACEKALRRALRSHRGDDLREQLARWSEAPPVGPASAGSLEDCARASARRAKRRLRSARTDADLHRARRAAKRARYAAELLQHRHRAAGFKRVQDVLGRLQDTVVAGQTLQRLSSPSRAASPREAFVLGALYGRELEVRARLRRRVRSLRT